MRAVCLLLFSLALSACTSSTTPPLPPDESALTYADHTAPRVESEADFDALSVPGHGTRELKFIVPYFDQAEGRHIRYLDGNFYYFHDEWYWYQLLRAEKVPGEAMQGKRDHGFRDPGEATAWASDQARLPLGLSIVDGRLYSRRFYELALGSHPRTYGLGSVFHVPSRTQPVEADEIWAFKLEYVDEIAPKDLEIYFQVLSETLPPSIYEQLVFVARSPQQYEVIRKMKAAHHPLSARLLEYEDLATAGLVEIYSSGLTAGRLRIIEEDEMSSFTTRGDEILVLPNLPDELPAAAGLITAVPQTPLSHINLLARNRGIPNLHLGGALSDVELRLFDKDEMPVVLHAEGDSLVIEPLDDKVYKLWRRLTQPQARSVAMPDLSNVPDSLELRASDFSRVDELRPAIGGKSSGFLALLSGNARVPTPYLALSVRPFVAHLRKVWDRVGPAVKVDAFSTSDRVRYAALEGPAHFLERFGPEQGQADLDAILEQHGGDALGRLIRLGGVQGVIRSEPMNEAERDSLQQRIAARFSELSGAQGLRFRSSSNVEDLEGFSGAGLYDSNTGFLFPELAADPDDQKRSIEYAIKKTWASFYGFAAFEERWRSGIDPWGGAMAVLVHPRFDDESEVNNGVFTLVVNDASYRPRTTPRYSVVVNVQAGAESVTNARSGVVPEVDVIESDGDSPGRIRRVSHSSESEGEVLSDANLQEILAQGIAVGRAWLAEENARLAPPLRRNVVVLDFEFRTMAGDWPARRDGRKQDRPRLVFKQVRSLEPVSSALPAGKYPIPPELLGRARRVARAVCSSKHLRVDTLRVFTNPAGESDLGFSEKGFVASLKLRPRAGLDWLPTELSLSHVDLIQTAEPPRAETKALEKEREPQQGWSVGVSSAERRRVRAISLKGGKVEISSTEGVVLSEGVHCKEEALLDHPDRLLLEALEAARN